MPVISDADRSVFQNLSKGVHNFDEQELARIHRAAEEISEVLKSVIARSEKRVRASFKQMG